MNDKITTDRSLRTEAGRARVNTVQVQMFGHRRENKTRQCYHIVNIESYYSLFSQLCLESMMDSKKKSICIVLVSATDDKDGGWRKNKGRNQTAA
uniref:Integrase n=1 Tax=Heterorhabditis bacteriophora TaxID=37862 RepID=A0A1I7XKT4_HETBA